MSTRQVSRVSYRSMSLLALVIGLCGIAFQFLPGWELFSFFLSVAVLGGLIGGSGGYAEEDRQRLRQSYRSAYEWLLLVVMGAYAFLEFARWVPLGTAAVDFLNTHWPGLMLSVMCALLGLAGLYRLNQPGS